MIITYYGTEFVKLQFGDTILALNPVSKDSKLPSTKFGADIALVSAQHEDFSGVENVAYGDREPFVISGPGEYEIKNVFIRGLPAESKYGGKDLQSTIYMIELEGMHICFMGSLGKADLDSKTLEAIDGVDIIFVPVSGEGVLDASQAHKLAASLEANVIIPIHYDKKTLDKFLKEEGVESIKPAEKLTIKKNDLVSKEGEVVVLKSLA